MSDDLLRRAEIHGHCDNPDCIPCNLIRALAAKLARAEGLLQRALAAFKAKGVVRGVDEWCDECTAYFAEQWAEAEQRRRDEDERYNLP